MAVYDRRDDHTDKGVRRCSVDGHLAPDGSEASSGSPTKVTHAFEMSGIFRPGAHPCLGKWKMHKLNPEIRHSTCCTTNASTVWSGHGSDIPMRRKTADAKSTRPSAIARGALAHPSKTARRPHARIA